MSSSSSSSAANTNNKKKKIKKRMVRLRSSDGEEFEVAEKAIGAASGMIKVMLLRKEEEEEEEEERVVVADNVITLPKVTGPILSRVLEYVNRHSSDQDQEAFYRYVATADDPLKRFDDQFVQVEQETLFDLIEAANYLHVQGLLDLTCRTVAEQMRGKTTEEIRRHFNIPNDYTPDEEHEVRRENSWCFQP